MEEKEKDLCCNFCDKPRTQVKCLIEGHGSCCICNDCVVICVELIFERLSSSQSAQEIATKFFHGAIDNFAVGAAAAVKSWAEELKKKAVDLAIKNVGNNPGENPPSV